jgi:hypothetical protein
MKVYVFFFAIWFTQVVDAQIAVTNLDAKSLPTQIKYRGHIVNAVQWKDQDGEHIALTTETGIKQTNNKYGEQELETYLHAYHYLKNGDFWQLYWMISDFVKQCSLDAMASFIKDAFSITDLDYDGKAEVWLMYRTACRSDVSPSDTKIIMYEGNTKYAMRGHSKVRVGEKEYDGGDYTFNPEFRRGPASFREYAQNLWNKNLIENLGDE